MTPASSRAVFLFVVQRGAVFMRRLAGVVATFLRQLCLAVLRIVITGLVFTICMLATLHYLGAPVPGPSELLQKFDGVERLVRILS